MKEVSSHITGFRCLWNLGLNDELILITQTAETEKKPCEYVWYSIPRVGFRGNYVLLNKIQFNLLYEG